MTNPFIYDDPKMVDALQTTSATVHVLRHDRGLTDDQIYSLLIMAGTSLGVNHAGPLETAKTLVTMTKTVMAQVAPVNVPALERLQIELDDWIVQQVENGINIDVVLDAIIVHAVNKSVKRHGAEAIVSALRGLISQIESSDNDKVVIQ